MATEQTGNSGLGGESWETAVHGQAVWRVVLCLVRTGWDVFSDCGFGQFGLSFLVKRP